MNSTPFFKLKRLFASTLFGAFFASLLTPAQAKEKKDEYPDYSRLEYAKPLPPVDEQVKEPKPGSINRKFGERPENPYEGSDPLSNIPIPLLRASNKGDDFEPPITDILESTEQPLAPPAKSTAPVVTSTEPTKN